MSFSQKLPDDYSGGSGGGDVREVKNDFLSEATRRLQ